jgi:hypothetical protein
MRSSPGIDRILPRQDRREEGPYQDRCLARRVHLQGRQRWPTRRGPARGTHLQATQRPVCLVSLK